MAGGWKAKAIEPLSIPVGKRTHGSDRKETSSRGFSYSYHRTPNKGSCPFYPKGATGLITLVRGALAKRAPIAPKGERESTPNRGRGAIGVRTLVTLVRARAPKGQEPQARAPGKSPKGARAHSGCGAKAKPFAG
jgi:hypothetical protein